jgi:ferrous iron transport protein A
MSKSLEELSTGKKARIVELDNGVGFRQKMEELNIREGKEVEKIVSQPFSGPVVIRIDNCTIALGRKMALRIFVEEIE